MIVIDAEFLSVESTTENHFLPFKIDLLDLPVPKSSAAINFAQRIKDVRGLDFTSQHLRYQAVEAVKIISVDYSKTELLLPNQAGELLVKEDHREAATERDDVRPL